MPSHGKTLTELAAAFSRHLESTKAAIGAVDFTWNPRDLSADARVLEQLLDTMGATLTELVRGQPVLDLHCGDGEMAFFLESIGCAATAVRQPAAGNNQLHGVAALKTALASSVAIAEAIPASSFGLAILHTRAADDGGLPGTLATLALAADYCFLPQWPAAAPLPESIHKAGWEVASSCTAPVRSMLLRRKDLFTNGRLLEGWYPAEGPRDGWRWAADLFTIRFQTPASGTVRFIFFVPPERLTSGPFTVGALRQGEVLALQDVTRDGFYHVDIFVPALARSRSHRPLSSDLTFWASPATAAPGDERLLGVVVHQILFTHGA